MKKNLDIMNLVVANKFCQSLGPSLYPRSTVPWSYQRRWVYKGEIGIRVGEGRARRLAYADKALRNGASLQLAYAAGTLVCFFVFWLHKDYYF